MFACTLFGIDRQVYYRKIKRRFNKQHKAHLVVNMVLEIRQQMPRIGAKKLYHLLNQDLRILKIGRDKFIAILRANHLLIIPKRSYHITTDSHHRFRKHSNQILDLEITKPEQVWVSDITYIGKREKPCYLSLITDAYSKKIVGYNVSDNLNTKSSLEALKLAIKQRKNKDLVLIHHSDRGLQYCANEYQKILRKNKIKPSMTQNSDPYENAVAERINGILKQEFNIDKYNKDLPIMKQIIKEVIQVYNQKRPHYSNHMLTPNQMHQQSNLKMRTYKRKNTCKNVLASV
ncbi:transposase [Flavobacterium sp. 9AF]|uniref:IS3 family transposase n=1 Tax=Flavobacterium sp. 9AF TaxID=2653142 RepID=UPI0012F100F7|nr:IS3 family transposase [Flavobacterium sp. 9AF]VXC07805.1 transposase [Flavobacterium sp. 9AF]